MAYIKMAWAIFLGSVVGVILGIVFDWLMLNGHIFEKGAEYASLYPWVSGGGAFFGAVMAVIVIGPPGRETITGPDKAVGRNPLLRKAQKPKPTTKPTKTKPAPQGKKPSPKDKDYVEGMPSFDFSAASKDIPSEPMPKGKGKK